jgi:hypothetical protein
MEINKNVDNKKFICDNCKEKGILTEINFGYDNIITANLKLCEDCFDELKELLNNE